MRLMSILKEAVAVIAMAILLPLLKLLVVIVGLAETAGWVYVGLWAVIGYQQHHNGAVFIWPLLATVAIYLQLNLWYYFWLKIAHSGDLGRAMGEYFCSALRSPIARPPHRWE